MYPTTQEQHHPRRTANDGDKAFFYADGIPTKGIWIDLESADSWADIHEALTLAGVTESDYGGEILCADVEGSLAAYCDYFKHGMLDHLFMGGYYFDDGLVFCSNC